MRLLLDEMHAGSAARALAGEGFDVVAVCEVLDFRGRADDDVLGVAAAQERAVVTENVRDFAALADSWATTGRTHHGIVFTLAPEDAVGLRRDHISSARAERDEVLAGWIPQLGQLNWKVALHLGRLWLLAASVSRSIASFLELADMAAALGRRAGARRRRAVTSDDPRMMGGVGQTMVQVNDRRRSSGLRPRGGATTAGTGES